jgi:hypothetical protein
MAAVVSFRAQQAMIAADKPMHAARIRIIT